MNTDTRAARSSMQRTASVSRTILPSGMLFAEPPVALPNLDELRASDVLVRAFYNTLVRDPSPPNPPATSILVELGAAAVQSGPTANATLTASPFVVAAEGKALGEVIGAALAREVVEAAARLYMSRQLDGLVKTYTACATWDEARDVVAGCFLPQDMLGSGLGSDATDGASTCTPILVGGPQRVMPTPVFMRSALSLAGVASRTPTSTLTPQSSLNPPPLGTSMPVRRASHDTAGPVPPARVPMDAFSRYVTVVEEAPTLTMAEERPSSPLRAPPTRTRATARKAKNPEQDSPVVSAATLSPSPPVAANVTANRGKRGSQKRSLQPSQGLSLLSESVPNRGKTLFGNGAQAPPEDPLTRALRQGPPPAVSDGAPGAARAERSPARPAVSTGVSSPPSVPTTAAATDGAKKFGSKQPSPRGGGGGVVAVEQDRLWSPERITKTLLRGGQRKDGVRCRVVPSEGNDTLTSTRCGETIATETAADGAVTAEAQVEQPGRRAGRQGHHNASNKAANGRGTRGVPAEREAWTASFFNATEAAGETSLQEQVQVTPSPGVTVVGGAPSQSAAQTGRRGHKAAAANASTVVHGGDFTVPADRLALSAFEEKRVAGRKPNGGGQVPGSNKTRPAQAFKTI